MRRGLCRMEIGDRMGWDGASGKWGDWGLWVSGRARRLGLCAARVEGMLRMGSECFSS